MLRLFSSLAVLLLALSQSLSALDKETILEIAKKPHDRKNLVPALRLWTEMRKFETTFTLTRSDKARPIKGRFNGTCKTVEGKYLVTEFHLPKIDDDLNGQKLISVITFDPKLELYRKWILAEGSVMEGVGTSASGSRAVSWSLGPGILSIEEHAADTIRWRQLYPDDEGTTTGWAKGVTRKLK